MSNRDSRCLLWTGMALCALAATAAFGQDDTECRPGYICFERGEAKLESTDDITSFLVANHEKLGLTGNETFRCDIQRWIAEYIGRDPPPEYAYICTQPLVQGLTTKYLSMRVDFWSRNDGVRSVRCRCVREDVEPPRPTIGRRQAEERGLVFIYARFPEVSPSSIVVIENPDPVVQWDWSGRSTDRFRLARNVLYHFPLFLAGRGTTVQGELTVSIDALDGSVLRAVDGAENLHGEGIPMTAIEEFRVKFDAMPFGEEQFDAEQWFSAFGSRGQAEAALIERRLQSRARWEPETRGRFWVWFADPASAEQLAAFLEDYEPRLLRAGLWYRHEGQTFTSIIEAQSSAGDPPAAAMRNVIERARGTAEADMASRFSDSTEKLQDLARLSDPAELQFRHAEIEMTHADALRLYETELGKRLLTLTPSELFANDLFLDLF